MVDREGGRAWVVGGAVRDAVLGLAVTDLDVEVHEVPAARLETLLAEHFTIDAVGRAFGVIKLQGVPIDVSLPRRESKAGLGHRGFMVESDPFMGLEAATRRRDFTINAMAFDPLTHQIVDPFGGREDLAAHRLRHCSDAFAEDPLRVLRGMQFAARFDLEGDPATLELCRGIEREGLAAERVWHEWRKLLLLGRKPSAGLRFLRDSGWLAHFPQLAALDGCPQDPEHHPEGDVYTHVGLCLDVFAAQRIGIEEEDLIVGLAVLCHDLGKPLVLEHGDDGRIRTPGHEQAGLEPASRFLHGLTGQPALVRQVLPLIAAHGRPKQLYEQKSGDAAIRRLSRDVGRVDRLVRVVRADNGGRGPASDPDPPAARWVGERAGQLAVLDEGPRPLVMGRHLIRLGVPPGPWVGRALRACYDAQLDGVFDDERGGLAYLTAWLERHGPGASSGPDGDA
ncbi:HD domain-containing protein [bacterium]|nr:HD domain-containing protein [bacterium]